MVPPIAPEVGMIRGYLDWIVALPWTNASEDNLDLERAQQILDAEHYGLPRVKDRILEHIAVRKLAKDRMKTPIMCFVGPPGVGKTSLGRSIARALGREFVRVSLGGVQDEAEIRGHRRTYIGAMPGRIIQTMRRAGTVNPVFMLDEIDKLGADFRGDPAAALLEALDPEQNSEYSDHYLDMDYDLSKVMFITTANDLYPLPEALLDRMEIIEFPSYTEEDKLQIARQFLIPEQLEAHGVADRNIRFERDSLESLVRAYTYEAGVRNLNREVGAICRKLARLVAENKVHPKRIRAKHIETYLGPPEFIALRANDRDSIGVATGVAWTPMGGDVLTIEASLMPGKGNMTLTGQLGDIMQESAQVALTYLRSRARDLDVPYDDFENYDVHIHLPEGAVPKDGPSAGITLATALISVFTERKIRADFSMTGEITLRGKVLPVGGIKEKLLAARRAQIKNIILPEHNRKDLVEIPARALKDLNIVFVEDMQQVIDAVLLEPPADGRRRDRDREEAEDEGDDA
jgi:ATP-dependent Lon protease